MEIFEYAYCGNFNNYIRNLSTVSPEKWGFGEDKEYNILKNYIKYTFAKVYDENKVIENIVDGVNYSIFNTGLFSTHYEPIYGYFVENYNDNRQKWFLQGFYTEFQVRSLKVVELPERANYFDNPEDLVFDIRLNIVPQYDHIFSEENLLRFPDVVRNDNMKRELFRGAVDITKRMLEANYKVAVPQYYNKKIRLLIPICLTNPNEPDLALACQKTDDKKEYLASTCLTLQMAYNNARLIAKPESNWLHA